MQRLNKGASKQKANTTLSGCGNSIGDKIKQSDESEKRRDYTCVYANDIDKYASAIYRYHWNDGTLYEGDIRTVDAAAIPDADLLVGGFPCQSFSIAGKRGGFEDTRGTLFFEMLLMLHERIGSDLETLETITHD